MQSQHLALQQRPGTYMCMYIQSHGLLNLMEPQLCYHLLQGLRFKYLYTYIKSCKFFSCFFSSVVSQPPRTFQSLPIMSLSSQPRPPAMDTIAYSQGYIERTAGRPPRVDSYGHVHPVNHYQTDSETSRDNHPTVYTSEITPSERVKP